MASTAAATPAPTLEAASKPAQLPAPALAAPAQQQAAGAAPAAGRQLPRPPHRPAPGGAAAPPHTAGTPPRGPALTAPSGAAATAGAPAPAAAEGAAGGDGDGDDDDGSGKKGCSNVKRAWSAEEDGTLLKMIEVHGAQNWSTIASHLEGRVGKQCRERWFNHLCPEVKKGDWTAEEDRVIMDSVKELGTCWSKIVKLLPGRTDNAIKNRYNSTMRKNLRAQLKPKPPPLPEPAPAADSGADGGGGGRGSSRKKKRGAAERGADDVADGAKGGGRGGKGGGGGKRGKPAGAPASHPAAAAAGLAIVAPAGGEEEEEESGLLFAAELRTGFLSPFSELGASPDAADREKLRALLGCSTPNLDLLASVGGGMAGRAQPQPLSTFPFDRLVGCAGGAGGRGGGCLGALGGQGTPLLGLGRLPDLSDAGLGRLPDLSDAAVPGLSDSACAGGRHAQQLGGCGGAGGGGAGGPGDARSQNLLLALALSPSDSPTLVPAGAVRRSAAPAHGGSLFALPQHRLTGGSAPPSPHGQPPASASGAPSPAAHGGARGPGGGRARPRVEGGEGEARARMDVDGMVADPDSAPGGPFGGSAGAERGGGGAGAGVADGAHSGLAELLAQFFKSGVQAACGADAAACGGEPRHTLEPAAAPGSSGGGAAAAGGGGAMANGPPRPGKIDLAAVASVGEALGRALGGDGARAVALAAAAKGGTPLPEDWRELDSAALIDSLLLSPAVTPGALHALERHLAVGIAP